MEIKVGATDDANSTHTQPSSSNSFFTEQALHAGLLGNVQNFGRRGDILGGSFDVTEAMIAREIEKRRIREEIIAAEILRRRELEAEVIRELMMEREIAMRRAEGFSLVDSPFSSLRSELRGPFLNRRDGFGFEERQAVADHPEGGIDRRLSLVNRHDGGIEGRLPLLNRPEGGVFGGLPFQRQPGVTNRVAVKPVIDLSKGQSVSLVKPVNTSVVGIKRKIESPINASGDKAAIFSMNKKVQKEWSCALCQVRATCEQGLKDHLKGKKHKAKEKALVRTTKSASNNVGDSDPLPKEIEKSVELAMPTGSVSPNLGNILDGNQDLKDVDAMDSELQNTVELKNTKFKFWCTLCNVGTSSEALMAAHRMGKKHTMLLKENGGGVIAIQTMPDNVQYVDVTREKATKEGNEVSLGDANWEIDGVGADKEEAAE